MVDFFFPKALEALRGKELPGQIPVILITSGSPPYLHEDAPDVVLDAIRQMVEQSRR